MWTNTDDLNMKADEIDNEMAFEAVILYERRLSSSRPSESLCSCSVDVVAFTLCNQQQENVNMKDSNMDSGLLCCYLTMGNLYNKPSYLSRHKFMCTPTSLN